MKSTSRGQGEVEERIDGKRKKSLCYIHFGMRSEPGLCKKLDAQIDQFQRLFDVTEIDLLNYQIKMNIFTKIAYCIPFFYKSKYDYDSILRQIDADIVYIRRENADKYYIDFLNTIKRNDPLRTIIVEIPTYPYFKDVFKGLKNYPKLLKEKWAIPKYKKYIDRFVTYSGDNEIFGVPTIKVRNGICVDNFEPRKRIESHNTINLLAVATFRKQHGYERIINGLANYYANGGDRNVILRMVGDGAEKQRYVDLVAKNHLQDHVKFLGKMVGTDLAEQYNIADIALGAMGLYKLGVFSSSALKIREYLAKGLPIVSGCHEDAFEDEPFDYYLEFPNDKSAIDINKIVNFYDRIYLSKSEDVKNRMVLDIREYAKRQADYGVVFQNVIHYLEGVN